MQKQKEIKKIVDQIVKDYKPEKVILFGSFASGKPKENSDVDLVVIKKTKTKFIERLKKIAKIVKSWEAFDILIYTPKEWQNALEEGNYFIEEITKTGKVVYEK